MISNAIQPISQELRQKIVALPIELILNTMDEYELSRCKDAFKERVEVIQNCRKGKE